MQTKLDSVEESLTNAVVGYLVLCAIQPVVIPWLTGAQVSGTANLKVALCIQCAAVIKTYAIRRLFAYKENL